MHTKGQRNRGKRQEKSSAGRGGVVWLRAMVCAVALAVLCVEQGSLHRSCNKHPINCSHLVFALASGQERLKPLSHYKLRAFIWLLRLGSNQGPILLKLHTINNIRTYRWGCINLEILRVYTSSNNLGFFGFRKQLFSLLVEYLFLAGRALPSNDRRT